MKVVILCGGQGTRMREETEYRPKPLVEIGGRPILWHIMKTYAAYGFNEFVLCLGYKGAMIKEYFLNYRAMNTDFTIRLGNSTGITYHDAAQKEEFSVTLVDTGLESMTGWRVKQVEKYIADDTFMVTYGDGVSDIDIEQLLVFHKAHGRLATVTTVQATSRFGTVRLDSRGLVSAFSEKPKGEDWISAGFFVFDRAVFSYLPDDPTSILERASLEQLAADEQLMAYRHDGFFYAMDTYREYIYLNELWASGKAPWRV